LPPGAPVAPADPSEPGSADVGLSKYLDIKLSASRLMTIYLDVKLSRLAARDR
jgi:hypothetical protein